MTTDMQALTCSTTYNGVVRVGIVRSKEQHSAPYVYWNLDDLYVVLPDSAPYACLITVFAGRYSSTYYYQTFAEPDDNGIDRQTCRSAVRRVGDRHRDSTRHAGIAGLSSVARRTYRVHGGYRVVA